MQQGELFVFVVAVVVVVVQELTAETIYGNILEHRFGVDCYGSLLARKKQAIFA